MADVATDEYQGKDAKERKALKKYRDAMDLAVEYCTPYFDKGVRFYKLFNGILPPELDGTFSKIMLEIAHAMIEDELPRSTRAYLTTQDWFNVRAHEVELEPVKDTVKKWLFYQMETVQRFPMTFIPTVQSAHIFGNGYRVYGHKFLKSRKIQRTHDTGFMGMPENFRDEEVISHRGMITGMFTDFFSVLPLPGGGFVNMIDDVQLPCVDGVLWIDYMRKDAIEAEGEKGAFNKKEIAAMFRKPGSDAIDETEQWRTELPQTSNWASQTLPAYIKKVRDANMSLSHRYQVVWFFERDNWMAVGEGKYILYDGPPLIDAIPIVNARAGFNLAEWFNRGLIETSEDVILSILLNFSSRADYLCKTFNPPTFVPQRLVDHYNGDESIFDGAPYSLIRYPSQIEDIQKAVFHDRYPDIPQQAFMEEAQLNQYLQKVSGQPDFRQGMQGGGNPGDIGATGVVSLIGEGAQRSMFRAMVLEMTGIEDSLHLTTKFGSKYVNEDQMIPVNADGMPWEMIPHEVINDQYGIEVTGSRNLNMAEETFKRMMGVAQLLIGNAAVQNQKGLAKEIMVKSRGFENVDDLIGYDDPTMGMGAEPGGQSDLQNETRSTNNRSTVQPNTGRQVAAGNLMV